MSDGKRKKRDRFLKLLGAGRSGSSAVQKTGLHHSPGTGESSAHSSTAASSATSVVSGVPPPKPQPRGATLKLNPTSQPGPSATTAAHTQQPISTAAGSTDSEAQSLREVIGSDQLFSQERKALAAFKSNPISQTGPTPAREQPLSAAADSTDPEARSSWSRAIDSEELSSQERQALADTGPGVDSRETAYLGKVEQLEKIVRQGASVVEAHCIIQP